MKLYWKETLHLLYLFWFKPLTLHEEMTQVAGERQLLDTSFLVIWRKKPLRQAFFANRRLLRLLGQMLLGNLLLLLLAPTLLVALSDVTGLTALTGWGGWFRAVWSGVAFGVALGVSFGVAGGVRFGVAFGVAVGVTGGVAVGVAGGVAGGVALGVVGGVAGGVAVGVASGVALGVALGVAFGVTGGAAFGIAFGIAIGVAGGVAGGVAFVFAFGVALGVAFGVAFGIAFGIALGVTFFRVPRTPLWVLWTLWQWWRARQQTSYAKRAFSQSVIQKDELIYLPLPGFNRFFALCLTAQTEHQAAIEMLTITARSTGQKWAVPYASTHWVANLGQQVGNLSGFGPLAGRLDSVADILQTLPRKSENVANLLRDFAAIAYSLAHVQEAHSLSVAHRVLERNRTELDTLRVRAEGLKNSQLAKMAVHWQRLIRVHAEQLEQLPREVLAGAYQAGSALETNSTLFRGRKELFALTSEVYANPNRAETLLLVAQQRMGKSSALMQLPAQLPDAHVVIVDCQRAISGSGDDIFAIGLSSAIYNEEKRRPGGVRLQPLTEETVGKHPLMRLNKWLEQYADKVRGKRVLLCLDEFDKLVQRVAEGKLSQDVLGVLRGLSQAPGWMVLYSGQYELDNWSLAFAEYIKNVRRVRVSYLKPEEARDLLTNPVPDFALTWEDDAIERALLLSGCQPYLLQMIGVQVVNRLTPTDRRTVLATDVDELAPLLFDEGRYYFQSLYKLFDDSEKQALQDIAGTGHTNVNEKIVRRLIDREYLSASESGEWQFCVPLLRDWFKQPSNFMV